MKKTIKRLLFGLLAVLIIVIAAFGLMFGKEIQTIASIKKVDDYGMYSIEYKADYCLDKLV